MTEEQKMTTDLWQQLIHGTPIDRGGLSKIDGRLDARNLQIAPPYVTKTMTTPRWNVTFLGGITTIQGADWRSIDFSGSRMPNLRLIDCHIEDCAFDKCRMQDLRAWGTEFSGVTFRSADLRHASLGGVNEGKRNSFRNVDFTKTDLRGAGFTAAIFLGCKFIHTKLDKIDFQSSSFEDCVFEGELREVQFYRTGFGAEEYPPNKMTRVDFRKAKLRWSEFRGLDLDDVFFPEDDDHIIVTNFPETLDRLLAYFRGRADLGSRKLFGSFEMDQKWLGSRQKVGVFNKRDLIEMAGEEGLRAVMNIIESVRSASDGRR
jgi:uncharacterized protein YjbI with pentapeptide repeats